MGERNLLPSRLREGLGEGLSTSTHASDTPLPSPSPKREGKYEEHPSRTREGNE